MKNIKKLSLLLPVLFLALSGCKPSKYTQLGDGLFADIQTTKGDIVLKLYHEQTPLTVASFVSLADGTSPFVTDSLKGKPYYDGLLFHRVMKGFIIQSGDPRANSTGGPGYKFDDEIVDSLKHDRAGILSMANPGRNANGSQFFITHGEAPHLDGKHTVFGEVVAGMATVDSIASSETVKGGATKDRPLQDIVMKHVEIVRNGKAAKNFDAVAVMTDYFDEINKREEGAKKLKETMAAEFKSREAEAETLPSGLKVIYLNRSKGEKPKIGQKVLVNYAGYLTDGTLFDSNNEDIETGYNKYNPEKKKYGYYDPIPMDYTPEARLIPGFREGLLLMNVGDKIRMYIPSALGYGPTGSRGVIPPNADLVFDVEIVSIKKQE